LKGYRVATKTYIALLLSSLVLLSACSQSNAARIGQVTTGGDPHRGAAAISRYGCGSCHIIPGISGAVGLTGPPLSNIAERYYIAGVTQNTPDHMISWLKNPKAIDEKTLMPNLRVSERDAADIAAYLYTLR
jgi:cytochrome c